MFTHVRPRRTNERLNPASYEPGQQRTSLRVAVATLLSLGLSLGLLGAAAPAHAGAALPARVGDGAHDPRDAKPGDVASAQDRVTALAGEVVRVADELTAGTRRYAADRARLSRVDRLLASNQSQVSAATRQSEQSRRTVGEIAGQLYRSPQPGLLLLSLSNTAADLTTVLAVHQDLQLVAGRQSDAVRQAVAARVRLQGAQQVVRQLRTEARELVARSAQQRSELVALAEGTSARLDAAQSDLASAEQAQQAQQARAAQQAAQQAARARAAELASSKSRKAATQQRGSQVARTQSAGVPAAGVPVAGTPAISTHVVEGCAGGSTAGQGNGTLSESSLCPLWSASGERLRSDAARAFNAMSRYKDRTTGTAICVTDSYRSYRDQVTVYRTRPGLAAVPGTSNHGWGRAVDLCGGAQSYGSAAYRWLKANAGRFGFTHPAWAEPGGGMEEPWHWEFG